MIGNTPPIVSNIAVEPDDQSLGRRLLVKADISDADGDAITVVYRWKKNRAVVKEGEDSDLDITGFSANDSIQVDVLASDGIAEAKPMTSNMFVMNNTPPKITSSPTSAVHGNQYDYQVTAKDPDGDSITYALDAAPPGMTIDAHSGMLRWSPGRDATGAHRVRVVARDARGGFDSQDFELSIAAPPRT